MDIWKKYKAWIVGGAIIIVLFVVVYFIGRASKNSKKPKSVKYDAINVNDDGSVTYEGTAEFNPGPLTDALYKDMDGHNLFSGGVRNLSPYRALLALQDPQFIAVYNDWLSRYYAKAGNKSLIQKLKDEKEWTLPGWAEAAVNFFSFMNPAALVATQVPTEGFAGLRDGILQKAKQIGME